MAKAGQALTDAEAAEYQAYGNAGLSAPDKFAGVVVDATNPRGVVYRYQTMEESKAADDAAKAAESAAAESDKMMTRIRGEAEKRGVIAADAAGAAPPMPGA